MTASLGTYVHVSDGLKECVTGWFTSHVCVKAISVSIFPSSSWTLTPFPFLLPFFILTRRFPLFSAHSLSCLYYVISASVPPGNFKEGTHAQKHFPSLLQAAGICRQLLEFQMPLLFAKHTPRQTSSPCLFVHEKASTTVVNLMFWAAASAAPLTSHTWWDDEMVCSTAAFMISSR